MFRSPAAMRSKYANSMRVVNHDSCVVLFGKPNDFRQRAQRTLHTEHTIDYD